MVFLRLNGDRILCLACIYAVTSMRFLSLPIVVKDAESLLSRNAADKIRECTSLTNSFGYAMLFYEAERLYGILRFF